MAHMSSIWKCDPPYAGYVLKKWHCSYIVRGVELAVIHKRRHYNLRQAWNAGPVPEGTRAVQR
jgi:hypothetical protein